MEAAELDRLPVSQRSEVGRSLITGLHQVSRTPAGMTEWRLRRIVGPLEGLLTVHLGFGVCSQYSRMHQDCFRAWVELRHHETQQITGEITKLMTVGVLLTPRGDRRRPWDTTIVAVANALAIGKRLATA